MGLWDTLSGWIRALTSGRAVSAAGANTPEGTREAMRQAYHGSRNVPGRGDVPITEADLPPGATGSPAHAYALWEALASRYWAAGVSRARIQERAPSIWAELMPFLYLDPDDAAEALTEYVVWKEGLEDFPWTASEARVDWLRQKVRQGVARAEAVDPSGWVAAVRERSDNDSDPSPWTRWEALL